MAARLCELVDLYSVSDDRQHIRMLSAADCQGGTFRSGGRELAFSDGRPTLSGLALKRKALDKAIEQISATP
jgi:hypothetical protein